MANACSHVFQLVPCFCRRTPEAHLKLKQVVVDGLMARFLNQGAKQHVLLWMDLLKAAKTGMAVRMKLKAAQDKDTKKAQKKDAPLLFDPKRSLTGKLEPGNLHALLRLVVDTDQQQLECASLPQLNGLLKAYGGSPVKGAKKEDKPVMVESLAGLIRTKDGLEQAYVDGKGTKAKAKAATAAQPRNDENRAPQGGT